MEYTFSDLDKLTCKMSSKTTVLNNIVIGGIPILCEAIYALKGVPKCLISEIIDTIQRY